MNDATRCDGCHLYEETAEMRVDDEGYNLCRDCQGQIADSLAQMEKIARKRANKRGK